MLLFVLAAQTNAALLTVTDENGGTISFGLLVSVRLHLFADSDHFFFFFFAVEWVG